MNNENINEIYRKFINDSVLLQNGKEFLENLLNTRLNFLTDSLNFFLNCNNETLQIRKYVGVLIKNLLKDNWETNSIVISSQQIIRQILLNGIAKNLNEPKLIEIMGLIISDLIIRDGVGMWIENLNELIKLLFINGNYPLSTVLDLFCIIFSRVDNRIHILAQILIPILLDLALKEPNEAIQEKILVLFYLNISSFSFADGTNNALVKESLDSTFDQWLQIFFSVLQSPVKNFINCKRYVLKILTILFRDFPHYTKRCLKNVVMIIWMFFNKLPPLFCHVVINDVPLSNLDENLNVLNKEALLGKTIELQKKTLLDENYFEEEDDEWDNDVEGLSIQAVELILTILNKHDIQSLIFCGLYPLCNTITNLLLISKQQENKWISEPNQFISDEEDEANVKSMRNICLKLISHLIENFSLEFLPILLNLIDHSMKSLDYSHQLLSLDQFYNGLQKKPEFQESSNLFDIKSLFISSAYKCSYPSHIWRLKEVGLLLLGSFAEDILDYQNNSNSDFELESLMKNILAQIQNENVEKIVLARGLWCLSKYSIFLEKKNKDILFPLCTISINCLIQNKEPALKLIATKSTSLFLFKTWKLGLNEEIISKIDFSILIKEFIQLFNIASEETIHIILEGLQYLMKISPENKKNIAFMGSSYFLKIFQMFHNEVLIGTLLQELLEVFVEDEAGFTIIFETFSPLILQVFQSFQGHLNSEKEKLKSLIKPSDISLITNLMDILKILLKAKAFAGFPNKNIIFQLMPALIGIILFNEDVALSVHANICLKYFIISFREEIKTNFAQDILNLIFKLTNLNSNENCLLYLGNLIMIVFHEIFNDIYNPEIIKNVLLRLLHVKIPSVVQNLLLIFSRMIILNPIQSFDFLYNFKVDPQTNGLKLFLEKVIGNQTVIKGKHVKNSICFSLTKVFLLKDPRLDQIMILESKAPIKIISTLIKFLEDETSNKIKIKSVDFDDYLYNDHEMAKENMEDFHEFEGEYYDGEEYEETFGQIDEESDNKMISEDFSYLDDICIKFELQEMLVEFFKELTGAKNNVLGVLNKEERKTLEKLIKN